MKSQLAAAATTVFLLAGTALGFPTIPPHRHIRATNGTGAAEIIAQIAPETVSCDLAETPDCRTNVEIAPHMVRSFQRYGVASAGEIAGVIALTAFESGDYKYKRNLFPGRPGQGTANMQMFPFNLEYARTFDQLTEQVAALEPISEVEGEDDDKKNQLLDLVIPDERNFGSGAWFLTAKCTSEVRDQLKTGTDAGFAAYMGCIGVEVTPERDAYWQRAKQALNL
ncbi:hypothetical protein DL768_010229 [Monosporascus sp. mg162]|nr:hypothetical protein DL768_010229 [Monosporascus sp. mg162]